MSMKCLFQTGFEIHALLTSFKNQEKKYKHTKKEFPKPISHKYLHLVWTQELPNTAEMLQGEYLYFKAHQQISKKRCFKNYCSCDKASQFSALQGTP